MLSVEEIRIGITGRRTVCRNTVSVNPCVPNFIRIIIIVVFEIINNKVFQRAELSEVTFADWNNIDVIDLINSPEVRSA